MKFICVIIFVNLFSAQMKEDNWIIEEGGGVMYDSKTACSRGTQNHGQFSGTR